MAPRMRNGHWMLSLLQGAYQGTDRSVYGRGTRRLEFRIYSSISINPGLGGGAPENTAPPHESPQPAFGSRDGPYRPFRPEARPLGRKPAGPPHPRRSAQSPPFGSLRQA